VTTRKGESQKIKHTDKKRKRLIRKQKMKKRKKGLELEGGKRGGERGGVTCLIEVRRLVVYGEKGEGGGNTGNI